MTTHSDLMDESSHLLGQFTDKTVQNATYGNFRTHQILQTTLRSAFLGEHFPGDPVSSATAHVVLTVAQAGILPVLTLGGVIMNVINMVVFLRQGLSDRINLCLFSLALADTGYISMSMTSRLYSIFSLLRPPLGHYWKALSMNLVGIYSGFLSASHCLTLLISLERCVCVLWPLMAKNLLSVRYMTAVIVLIFIVCLSFCSLKCFQFYLVSYRDPLTNATHYYSRHTRFFLRNPLVVDIIFDMVFTLSVPTLCLLGVLLATSLISLRMRSVLSWRLQTAHVGASKSVTSADRRETLVTRMLLVVCVVFTICTIPGVVQAFTRFLVAGFAAGRHYNNTFFVTICLSHMTATVNSFGNFFIYWSMSTKFKDTLRGLVWGNTKAKETKHGSEQFSNAGCL